MGHPTQSKTNGYGREIEQAKKKSQVCLYFLHMGLHWSFVLFAPCAHPILLLLAELNKETKEIKETKKRNKEYENMRTKSQKK